jgi:hypothetical protein
MIEINVYMRFEQELKAIAYDIAPYAKDGFALRDLLSVWMGLTTESVVSQPNDWVYISRIAQEVWDDLYSEKGESA